MIAYKPSPAEAESFGQMLAAIEPDRGALIFVVCPYRSVRRAAEAWVLGELSFELRLRVVYADREEDVQALLGPTVPDEASTLWVVEGFGQERSRLKRLLAALNLGRNVFVLGKRKVWFWLDEVKYLGRILLEAPDLYSVRTAAFTLDRPPGFPDEPALPVPPPEEAPTEAQVLHDLALFRRTRDKLHDLPPSDSLSDSPSPVYGRGGRGVRDGGDQGVRADEARGVRADEPEHGSPRDEAQPTLDWKVLGEVALMLGSPAMLKAPSDRAPFEPERAARLAELLHVSKEEIDAIAGVLSRESMIALLGWCEERATAGPSSVV